MLHVWKISKIWMFLKINICLSKAILFFAKLSTLFSFIKIEKNNQNQDL